MRLKKLKRYYKLEINGRELDRLLGMLLYVDFDRAMKRYRHPYTQFDAPEKDQKLITKLARLTSAARKEPDKWIEQ